MKKAAAKLLHFLGLPLSSLVLIMLLICLLLIPSRAAEAPWKPLFNGKSLEGWDTWLGLASSGYHDLNDKKEVPLGLNNDPLGVFTVVQKDGAAAIRLSGQAFGAITSKEEFGNVHLRVEYKWGEKKWPPREEPRHYRDSGLLYWCIGPHGAGSGAWMRSVECNIMEKGVGQWWGVAGTYVDIEGRKVVLENEPFVPYRGEAPGEQCILYVPGGPQFTTGEGITSSLDPEKSGDWNVCEVIAWGNVGVHLLNGDVVLALTNPRFRAGDREFMLGQGKIQLQSEGAEVFYRKIEAQPLTEIPPKLLSHVPPSAPDEKGFSPLFGNDPSDGWKQCGPGNFTLKDGVATGHGGMGLWWYTNRVFTNFVLRGEWMQEGADSDSGVFVRFPDPGNDPWIAVKQGHEFEIGDAKATKREDGTGAFYPFHGPAEVPVKPCGEWNSYELTCVGKNYSLRLNGKLVNTWTDDQNRPLTGYIGFQNYPYKQTVHHRNVRVKDLPPIALR